MYLPFQILYKKYTRVKEEFQPHKIASNSCPQLLKVLEDEVTYNRMAKKLVTVKNDEDRFMGFRDGSPFSPDASYCYVSTMDTSNSKDKNSICSKNSPVYNYNMIKSLHEGTVFEDGSFLPRNVCVMEIDPHKVNASDVQHMGLMIDRQDNTHLVQSLEEHENTVKQMSGQIVHLEKQLKAAEQNVIDMQENFDACANKKKIMENDMVLLKAAIDALNGNIVVISLNGYSSSESISHPRLTLNTRSGERVLHVPQSFNISHIFLPPNTRVRLTRMNSTFVDYDNQSSGYPTTTGLDLFNTVRLEQIM